MITLLFFGFLIGMRHALEADHLAAVASISTKEHTLKASIKHGIVWGVGHTLTLFIFGVTVLLLDRSISAYTAEILEVIVGFMLVGLGVDVFRRLIKQKVHFHTHQHNNTVHFHAHSHQEQSKELHSHSHEKFPFRTLFIGLMHGLAGTAALILLTLDTIESFTFSMIYIALFGVGSIAGMLLLSVIIAVPLRASSKLTWLHNGLQAGIAVLTVSLGASIIYQSSVWL
ncbi:MAG: urease accessory protein [Gammaproteobacteria bacterium]|nr:MAG: urease accessory protein [Gammaproteobacteria bacterium]